MKISYKQILSIILILLVVSQLYIINYKISYVLQLIILLILLSFQKVVFKKFFFDTLVLLSSILFLGFIGSLINNFNKIDFFKDIVFFSKPVISLLLSYQIFKFINSKEIFFRIIINLGVICAIIHLYIVVFITNHNNIHDLRAYTKDNFIELFSLYFLFNYFKEFGVKFTNQLKLKIIYFILIVSIIFYFSRMMIIIGLILFISHLGYTRLNKKSIIVLITGFFSLLGFYTLLNLSNIDRNGDGLEAFLYKIKIAPEEVFKSKIDKDNHQDLWDHWRGYEAKMAFELMNKNPSSFIFGNGHGSLVNLKMFAPLVEDPKGIKFISHLHNGYAFIFYKLGIIGLILYFTFLFKLYWVGQNNLDLVSKTISAISIIYFITTLTITGVYNTVDNIIFILGGLIFYYKVPSTNNNYY